MFNRHRRRTFQLNIRISPTHWPIFVARIAFFSGVLAYVAHFHEALAIASWIDVEVSNHSVSN
jgi:hypothetical protein